MIGISKVYTRVGDKGQTQNASGSFVDKDSLEIELIGQLDELGSFVGLTRTLAIKKKIEFASKLADIQKDLFDLGGIITCLQIDDYPRILPKERIEALEREIDFYNKELSLLKSFVLAGGSLLNSYLHICRSICRRVERRYYSLQKKYDDLGGVNLIYLNRLSDYFFVLARFVSKQQKIEEFLWKD